MSGIRDFGLEGVVGESPDAAAGGGVDQTNGEAEVGVASYEPQRMTLDVNASGAALVATSVTRWPGWKLTIDGRSAPLVRYNHAFLAFRVPAGRHTAVLRYLPDTFVIGSVISVLTMMASAWLLLRPRGIASRG